MQGLKIALVCSYLRLPQAVGQVKILIVLVKIIFYPIYANNFCDAGQVPIFRYFEAWYGYKHLDLCPFGLVSFRFFFTEQDEELSHFW